MANDSIMPVNENLIKTPQTQDSESFLVPTGVQEGWLTLTPWALEHLQGGGGALLPNFALLWVSSCLFICILYNKTVITRNCPSLSMHEFNQLLVKNTF
jgi:hypothetical protein